VAVAANRPTESVNLIEYNADGGNGLGDGSYFGAGYGNFNLKAFGETMVWGDDLPQPKTVFDDLDEFGMAYSLFVGDSEGGAHLGQLMLQAYADGDPYDWEIVTNEEIVEYKVKQTLRATFNDLVYGIDITYDVTPENRWVFVTLDFIVPAEHDPQYPIYAYFIQDRGSNMHRQPETTYFNEEKGMIGYTHDAADFRENIDFPTNVFMGVRSLCGIVPTTALGFQVDCLYMFEEEQWWDEECGNRGYVPASYLNLLWDNNIVDVTGIHYPGLGLSFDVLGTASRSALLVVALEEPDLVEAIPAVCPSPPTDIVKVRDYAQIVSLWVGTYFGTSARIPTLAAHEASVTILHCCRFRVFRCSYAVLVLSHGSGGRGRPLHPLTVHTH
jgi:hypothetical protein